MVDSLGSANNARPLVAADGRLRAEKAAREPDRRVDPSASRFPQNEPAKEPAQAPVAENRDQNSVTETAEAIREVRESFGSQPTTRLSILFDKQAGLFISRSLDAETGEVLRQFPPESVVKRVTALAEQLASKEESELDLEV